ncbi:hypothetical protein IMG5_028570, partial [Ichthyophthirius multifiliis]
MSGGEWVTYGYNEQNDLECVVQHLKKNEKITHLGLFGRSMGGFISLLYSSRDENIKGIVTDSAFINLKQVLLEVGQQK